MSVSSFPTLMKARSRLIFNNATAGGYKNVWKYTFVALLALGFVTGDYLFFRRLFVYFNDLPMDVGEILIIQLVNTLCLTFFSMLIFSNIIASISTLFLSRDLDLLHSSPIPIFSLFISRLIQTLVNSSWMALLFALPVFVAYGELYYASFAYYISLPFLFLPFLIIACSSGVTLTLCLMRFFPAKRTYQIMSFIGVVFIGALVMFFRFLQPEKYVGKDVPKEMIISFVEQLKTPDYPWLPSSTLASALKAGAFSDWSVFLGKFSLLWGIALIATTIASLVAVKIYYAGWSGTSGSGEIATPGKERLLYRVTRIFLSTIKTPPDMRAILMKDMKLFWRETSQWSQLFMLGALVVVYLFNIRNLPLETFYLRNIVSVMNIGLAGIVLAAVAARFVFATTSVEGRSFWAVHSAPISFTRFLWAKFFLYVIPLLVMAEALVVISNIFLGVDAFVISISAGAIALMTLGLTGLGVGLGATWPRFDFENVAEIGASTGAIVYMIISLIYAGVSVSLVAKPVQAHLMWIFMQRDIMGPAVYLSYIGFILLTILFVIVPMRIGVRSLDNMET